MMRSRFSTRPLMTRADSKTNSTRAAIFCAQCGTRLPFAGPGRSCMSCLLLAGSREDEEDSAESERARGATVSAANGLAAIDAAETPRRCFGHYEIALNDDGDLWELGRGTMGVTFKALDTVLHYGVALKVINARAASHEDARARFLREARAAAQLHHPHVAGVFHFGETAEQCFYAMELVEGETLDARVRREGKLPLASALEVAIQVARALVAAEARGLIHRDLKPSNLMLVAGADALTVKVIDFGLAKAVAACAAHGDSDLTHGGFVGTPTFASPEQFAGRENGEPLDARSDIYSLGVTLWFLLTGKIPFPGRTLAEIYQRQVQQPLPVAQLQAAQVPEPLVGLLETMLATDPADRPQSAAALVAALRRCREQIDGVLERPGRRRRRALAVAGAIATIALAASAGYFVPRPPAVQAPAIPMKSIAVLPFASLSGDKENTYFADGIQDDILTNLARVPDLKVISRTSVGQYKTGTRNLREIGRALGVAHILEGSVRRTGNRVRVSAQLINAQTDAHLWGETFDREVTDLFALQSELSERIATALKGSLSPTEKARLQSRPTTDMAAYELYLRAKEAYCWQPQGNMRETWERGLRFGEEAVARDPYFAHAYCAIAMLHDDLYWFGYDRTPARLAQVKAALDKALTLRPDLPEAHVALAYYYYHGFRDYPRARAELAIAQRTIPNDADIWAATAYLDRRQDRWDDSVVNLQKACELDPRNFATLSNLIESYLYLGRYEDAAQAIERGLVFSPNSPLLALTKASLPLAARAELEPLRAFFRAHPPTAGEAPELTFKRIELHLLARDCDAAERALEASPPEIFENESKAFRRALFRGLIARGRGAREAAQAAFELARRDAEADLAKWPEDADAVGHLGVIEALLGRKAAAVRAGRRAVELLPIARDSWDGVSHLATLAMIYAQVGERDLAIEELKKLVSLPGRPTHGDLRLNSDWDPLRGDPRFEEIVAAPAKHPPRANAVPP